MANGFRIAARALRQLGTELITSDEIALNELIKNAFDAKSKRVVIEINSPFSSHSGALLSEAKSWPVYPSESVDRFSGYIEAGLSKKKYSELLSDFIKHKNESTVDALKRVINEHCFIVIDDQGEGMSADELKDNFLVVGTPGKWILKQNDSTMHLLGEKGVGRLSMMRLGKKARLESGKEGSRYWSSISFNWSEFDDPNKYMDDIEIPVIAKSGAKEVSESGTLICISELENHWDKTKVVSFVNEYLRRLQNPFSTRIKRFPVDVIFNGERVDIERIHPWFKNCANFSAVITFDPCLHEKNKPVLIRSLKWFGKDTPEIREKTIDELARELSCNKQDLIDLGPININCLWYNRADLRTEQSDKSATEVKEELNLWCGGYAIYRDNFRIGMTGSLEDDWLKMDRKTLTSKGFMFNRYQTVGAISLSQRRNPFFVDSANREKLIDCNALRLLKELMTEIVNKDIKSHIEVIREAENKKVISESASYEVIRNTKENLNKTIKSVGALKKYLPSELKSEIPEITRAIKTTIEDVRRFEKAVSLVKEQRIEILELASMGMVVDKIVHELARLTSNTTEFLQKLERTSGSSEDIIEIIKVIKDQIKATNKRIRSVDRLSPSGRNRKDQADVVKLVEMVVAGYKGRFTRHSVEAAILVNGENRKEAYTVKIVSGLVAQILENLLSNSLYWLQVGLAPGETQRKITIDIDTKSSTITFCDNGPGIAPEYANDVFRPYHTTKPKGKGLGLFISKELAAYHKGDIYLDSSSDKDGRLRCFVLELPSGE